jgi:hypothetical protein
MCNVPTSPPYCSRFFCYEGIRVTWKWDTIIFHTHKKRRIDHPVWMLFCCLYTLCFWFRFFFFAFCGSAGWWSRGHKHVWLRTMSHMRRTRRTLSWARWYQNICASSKPWLQIKIVPELSILLMTLTVHRFFHSLSHVPPDPWRVDTSAADIDARCMLMVEGRCWDPGWCRW